MTECASMNVEERNSSKLLETGLDRWKRVDKLYLHLLLPYKRIKAELNPNDEHDPSHCQSGSQDSEPKQSHM